MPPLHASLLFLTLPPMLVAPADLEQTLYKPSDFLSRGIPADTPFQEAMLLVSVRSKVKIEIDTAAFAKAGAPNIASAKVQLEPVTDIPLELALQFLLDTLPVPATFKTRRGAIVIIPGQRVFQDQSATSRLDNRLRTRTDDYKDGVPETPFLEALQQFRTRSDLPLWVRARGFADSWEELKQKKVKLPGSTGVLFSDILKRLLAQVDATYIVRNEYILIVAKGK